MRYFAYRLPILIVEVLFSGRCVSARAFLLQLTVDVRSYINTAETLFVST